MSNSHSDEIRRIVGSQIELIKKDKGAMATLRRGAGRHPCTNMKLLGMLLEGLPEDLMSKSKDPSYAEWAIYISLTLFAVHQQGNDPNKESELMHQSCWDKETHKLKKEKRLGGAIAQLIHDKNDIKRLTKRFIIMASRDDMEGLSHYLRQMIGLLRKKNIPLDYVDLASDLYSFQFPESKSSVKLKWGEDFYRVRNKFFEEEEGSSSTNGQSG